MSSFYGKNSQFFQQKRTMLQLTDQDKQEIIRHIESNQALPDKYRFLLFDDKREVELVWNGKTNEVCNLVLPFQVIEQVDEPRAEKTAATAIQMNLFNLDARGRQLKGWTNKLIWGDNKLILSSLKNGPLREYIEAQGGLKLIYIDPPFDVGADFSMNIEIGGDTFTKKANILEEIAYRDTWGRGADSFISMIYERLLLMRDLLAEDGSIYVHCDWRVNGYIQLVLEEIFGSDNLGNTISWKRSLPHGNTFTRFGQILDSIFWYRKSDTFIWNPQYFQYSDESIEKSFRYTDEDTGRKYQTISCLNPNPNRPNLNYDWNGHKRTWKHTQERMQEMHDKGLLVYSSSGLARYKMYLDEAKGVPVQDLWDDINLLLVVK